MQKFILMLMTFSFISLSYAKDTQPPFSAVVKVENMLYLSGQIGSQPGKPALVAGGIRPETRQAMENIKQVLEKNHSSLSNIVKCMIVMADMKEWSAMNEEYASFFPKGRYPARTTFGSSGLVSDARVEIECMATVTR